MGIDIKFSLNNSEEKVHCNLYKSLIGSLLGHTPLDITFGASLSSWFIQSLSPSKIHWGITKKILRHLKDTISHRLLWYSTTNEFLSFGCLDSDWASSIEDRRSTTCFAFNISRGAICWSSKMQSFVALSFLIFEYITVNIAACQAI